MGAIAYSGAGYLQVMMIYEVMITLRDIRALRKANESELSNVCILGVESLLMLFLEVNKRS